MADMKCSTCGAPLFVPTIEGAVYQCACGGGKVGPMKRISASGTPIIMRDSIDCSVIPKRKIAWERIAAVIASVAAWSAFFWIIIPWWKGTFL